MLLWTALVVSVLALGFSLWAATRRVAPRLYGELRGRVEDVETDLEGLHSRFSAREKRDSMANARDVAKERKERRDTIEQEAAQIISAVKSAPQQPQLDLESPEGRLAVKRELQRRMLGHFH